jgi:hypothetical protein
VDEGGETGVLILTPLVRVLNNRHVQFKGLLQEVLLVYFSKGILDLDLFEGALRVEVVGVEAGEEGVVEDAGELLVVLEGVDGHLEGEVMHVVGVEVEGVEGVVVVNGVEENQAFDVPLHRVVVHGRVEFVPRVDLPSVHEGGFFLGGHGGLCQELDEFGLLVETLAEDVLLVLGIDDLKGFVIGQETNSVSYQQHPLLQFLFHLPQLLLLNPGLFFFLLL